MSSLKTTDKTVLENLFEMKGGYVLDFTDRTMSNFFKEELDIDIYNEKYDVDFSSRSKANRLRGIWLKEDNKTTSKIILSLIDYLEINNLTSKKGIPEVTATLIEKAKVIANKLIENGFLSEESSATNKTVKITFLPEINNGTFSEQALDLVAKEFTNHLSNYEIRKIVYSINELPRSKLTRYPLFV